MGEGRRGLRHQHLPTAGRGHDTGGPVRTRAEFVVGGRRQRRRVQPDAGPQRHRARLGQPTLALDGRGHRADRVAEHGHEPFAGVADHLAAAGFDRRPHDRVVFRPFGASRFRLARPARRRALDVGEQKGDRPSRTNRHVSTIGQRRAAARQNLAIGRRLDRSEVPGRSDRRVATVEVSQEGNDTDGELADGLVVRQSLGGQRHVVGHPRWEWSLVDPVRSRGPVLLVDGRQPLDGESIGHPDQGRPQPAVDERHLPGDQPRADDVGGVGEAVDGIEDGVARRVTPPTSPDRLAGDQFGDVGDRATGGLEEHSVLTQRTHRHHPGHPASPDSRSAEARRPARRFERVLAVVVVLAVVAVAAIVAVFATRAKLVTERERVVAATTAASERAAELALAHEELATSRSALAAETADHAADVERLEQVRADLVGVEQVAAEAEQRARDAAAASGVEPGVMWPLELQRSERLWRFSVSPGPQADSPLAATSAPLITALKVEVDAARNDVGADVELDSDVPPDIEPATAVLVLRIAQELLADVVRRSETATLRVTTDGDDIVVAVVAVGRDGAPVLPEPLPVESPLIAPIENGVRLVGRAASGNAGSRTPPTDQSAWRTANSGAGLVVLHHVEDDVEVLGHHRSWFDVL